MTQRNTLIEALKEEDRLLRAHLAHLPRSDRERPAPDGGLSLKDILGHIAFWDEFTVRFFECKLDATSMALPPPVRFEERSREALRRLRPLPFGEVLARYLEATEALLAFLAGSWDQLSEREKHDFWVPLKHRRVHRLRFERGWGQGSAAGADALTQLAEGA
ncbi:DinB family protein [bacterium]|nr:DinB family protein [bacterium]